MPRPSPISAALTFAILVAALGCEPRWLGALEGDDLGGGIADAGGVRGRVLSTTPADGDEEVSLATPFLVEFSRPMNRRAGALELWESPLEEERWTLLATVDTPSWLGDRDLDRPGDRRDVAALYLLGRPLSPNRRVRFRIGCSHRAADGERVCGEDVAVRTVDTRAPSIRGSTPREGADGVSPYETRTLSLTFDEPMDLHRGALRLEGAGGSWMLRPRWEGAAARFALPALAYETAYAATPEGFRDRAGNPLDLIAYLGDGVLDFRTGGDDVPPRVLASSPAEGQQGVNYAIEAIELLLSEPLDDSPDAFGWGLLTGAGELRAVRGTLTGDGTRLRFDLSEPLRVETDYRLDLASGVYRDRAGNRLDRQLYLEDGALDFRVSEDVFGPRVLSSTPLEGAREVPVDVDLLELRFDEPIDPSSGPVRLIGPEGSRVLAGDWDDGGTRLTLDVREGLVPNAVHRLDLRGLADRLGNRLDRHHVYLGDGLLDFVTGLPSGDDCRQPWGPGEGTATTSGWRWEIPAHVATANGRAGGCGDPEGADVVLRLVKTSDRLRDGGRLLHVDVRSSSGTPLAFELRGAECAPGSSAPGSSAPGSSPSDRSLMCQTDVSAGGATLDVPRGLYHLWVRSPLPGTFPGATVIVEERDAWPEGESCGAPYTTASAVHRSPGAGTHVFEVPPTAVADNDGAARGGAIPCAPRSGTDAVVAFDKGPDTVLEVRAAPVRIGGAVAGLRLAASRGCEPDAGSTQPLACVEEVDHTTELRLDGPEGRVFLWLASTEPSRAFPGATVEIVERAASPGETCATALLLGEDGAVRGGGAADVGARGCGSGAGLTWYRVPSEALATLTAVGTGELPLVDAQSGDLLRCAEAGVETSVRVRPGAPLCVGVPAGVSSLRVDSRVFPGVRGERTAVPMPIPGGYEAPTAWLAETPSALYRGLANPPTVLSTTGTGGLATPALLDDPRVGAAAAVVGERLFALASEERSPRLQELADGPTLPWSPAPWELGSAPLGAAFAVTVDGGQILVATHEEAQVAVHAVPTSTPSLPRLVGVDDTVRRVVGMAADATYLYLRGEDAEGRGGVYRIRRDTFGTVDSSARRLAEVAHAPGRAAGLWRVGTVLYARQTAGRNAVFALVDAGGPNPVDVGPILFLGRRGEGGLAPGADGESLLLWESESDPAGRLLRVR